MTQLPEGTPDDWWKLAEVISTAEAQERTLGDWYITLVRTAGDTKPGYRLSTPSKPANQANLLKLHQKWPGVEAERVRCLVRTTTPPQPWLTSELVQADFKEGSAERVIWVRKNSGRWHSLRNGNRTANDHQMALLRPVPASIMVGEELL